MRMRSSATALRFILPQKRQIWGNTRHALVTGDDDCHAKPRDIVERAAKYRQRFIAGLPLSPGAEDDQLLPTLAPDLG